MAIGLGHVVGMLLGHGQRYGKALVRIDRAGHGATEWAVEFRKPDRWRADDGPECQVSDGTTRTVTLDGGIREQAPARPDSVPMALYPFFPIATPIWGRGGDDWRMLEGPVEDDGKICVELESIREPGYSGNCRAPREKALPWQGRTTPALPQKRRPTEPERPTTAYAERSFSKWKTPVNGKPPSPKPLSPPNKPQL